MKRLVTSLIIAAVVAGCATGLRTRKPQTADFSFEDLLISGNDASESLDERLTPDFFIGGWDSPANDDRDGIEGFAEGYLGFLNEVRTEYGLHRAIRSAAAAYGFKNADLLDTLTAAQCAPGAALYFEDARGNNAAMVRMGRRPAAEGCRIVLVRTDLPVMEIKPRPVFADQGFMLLQTAYTGVPRKHQWLSVPLALQGEVFRRDGTAVEVDLGTGGSGVLVIPDLLPHLAYGAQQHRLIGAEKMDAVADLSVSDSADTANAAFLELLQRTTGVTAGDFSGARLELIPAAGPVEVGVDRGMVGGYGQMAKLPAYVCLEALAELDAPEYTLVVLAVNGLDEYDEFSLYPPMLADLIATLAGAVPGSAAARKAAARSVAVATGTMPAVNPLYKDGWAETAYGPVVIVAGEDGDAAARITGLFADGGNVWQLVDKPFRRRYLEYVAEREGVQCVNVLCPLLAEGSFCELASKMDLYLTYDAIRAFLSAVEL